MSTQFEVTEALDHHGFARLSSIEPAVRALTCELFGDGVGGTPVRLQRGDVVVGEDHGATLKKVRLVTAREPPTEAAASMRALLSALAHEGIDVPLDPVAVVAAEERLDLRQLGQRHPVLEGALRSTLTFLVDWERQGYPDRQEHPFDDMQLPGRICGVMREVIPSFELEHVGDAWRLGTELVSFADFDFDSLEGVGALAARCNARLRAVGASKGWHDLGGDWVWTTEHGARLLREHELLTF